MSLERPNVPDRRAFGIATAAYIFLLRDSPAAVPGVKTWRLGLLGSARSPGSPLWAAFDEELARKGLVEGKAFSWMGPPVTELSQLDALASDLVKANVDIIVTDFREGVASAKRATKTIPIVMLVASDAVREGWVASFARPGGNLTGTSGFPIEMEVKRLQILIQTLERPKRLGYFVFAPFRRRPAVVDQIKRLEEAAGAKGAQLRVFEVEEAYGSLGAAFERAANAGVQGLVIHNHATIGANSHAEVGDLAMKFRLPSIMSYREYAVGGVLLSYSEDTIDTYRKGATYVAKIMAGAKPGELPVEFPTRFEFVINLKTAAALGLHVPASVLSLANEVIR